MMRNFGGEVFDEESFKAIYDSDPRVKELVSKFDPDGVTLKTAPEEPTQTSDTGAVDDMAQSATANAMAS